MGKAQIFFGRNPLIESLRAGLKPDEVYLEKDADRHWLKEMAKNYPALNQLRVGGRFPPPPKGQRSQGVAFRLQHDFYSSVDEIDWPKHPFVLFCNHLEDVQNLGSITRTAAAFSFRVLVHEDKRSVSMNEQALRISMGLAFHIRFVAVSNLLPLLLTLQRQGFELAGMAADAPHSVYSWGPREGGLALVLGSESKGISLPIRRKLDSLLRIPMKEGVDSLNVGQAGAIAMSHIYSASHPEQK